MLRRCTKCTTEVPDDARFCAECGHQLPPRCQRCGYTNVATARFCGRCGHRLAAPPTAPVAVPEASAERRHLTVMFCDLTDSAALSARLDPEDHQ